MDYLSDRERAVLLGHEPDPTHAERIAAAWAHAHELADALPGGPGRTPDHFTEARGYELLHKLETAPADAPVADMVTLCRAHLNLPPAPPAEPEPEPA